jgi:hypothetical protein
MPAHMSIKENKGHEENGENGQKNGKWKTS